MGLPYMPITWESYFSTTTRLGGAVHDHSADSKHDAPNSATHPRPLGSRLGTLDLPAPCVWRSWAQDSFADVCVAPELGKLLADFGACLSLGRPV